MKLPPLLLLVAVTSAGCAKTDEGDTSPLPPSNPQSRVDRATQGIEQSNMTPAQKQAALDYVKQNSTTASKMKENAPKARN